MGSDLFPDPWNCLGVHCLASVRLAGQSSYWRRHQFHYLAGVLLAVVAVYLCWRLDLTLAGSACYPVAKISCCCFEDECYGFVAHSPGAVDLYDVGHWYLPGTVDLHAVGYYGN